MKLEKFDNLSAPAEEEQNFRAKKRNEYRPIQEKILFKEKVTGEDMAMEQAIEMDIEAERLVNSGEAATFLEAIQKLNQDKRFALKTKEVVEKEEFARAKSLQIIKLIKRKESWENYKAYEILKGIDNKEILSLTTDLIKPFITEEFIDCLKRKNARKVGMVLELFSDYINNDDLAKLPPEVLKSEEIIAEISRRIAMQFKYTTCNHRDNFREVAKIYAPFFSYEEIIQSPIIKKMAEEAAIHDLEYGFLVGVENLWKYYIEAGVLTHEEIVNMPEIKKGARVIAQYTFIGGALGRSIVSAQEDLVKTGIISEAEAKSARRELETEQY